MSNIKLAFFSNLSPEAKGALVGSLVFGGASALGRYNDEAADYDLPKGVDFHSLTDKQKARIKKKGGKFLSVLGSGLTGAAMGGGLGYLAGRMFGGSRARGDSGGAPGGAPGGTNSQHPSTSPEVDPDPRANLPMSKSETTSLGLPRDTRAGDFIAMGSSNIPSFVSNGRVIAKPEKITTIGSELEPIYANAPGGLQKAVNEAQKWQSEANSKGLITWDRKALDRPIRWTDDLGRWLRASSDDTQAGKVKGQLKGLNIPLVNWTFLNPKLRGEEKNKTFLHELTHGALRPTGMAGYDQIVKGVDSVASNPYADGSVKNEMWKYVSKPEEWKAHLAQVKREWVKNNKDQLDTPDKAVDALKEYLRTGKSDGSMLTPLIEDILNDPDAKDKAILQLLSIVRGAGKSNKTIA